MKILIIRFSSIGDIVLTTPIVRCLKQQQPDTKVHFLTKAEYWPLVGSNPYIDKLHYLGEEFRVTIDELKKEKFDCIIDLHNNARTIRVKQALKIKDYTYNKLNIQKFIFTKLKLNLMPDKSIVDRYFEAVKPLKVLNDGKGLDYFVPDKIKINNEDIPMSHWSGYAACVIGGSYNTKKLPVEQWKKFCATFPYPVILVGGPEDRNEGKLIAEPDPVKIYNSCGKFNLNESAELVKHARVVISNDTGLMHVAAAFQKPIVSLWGNTAPELGMFPYYGYNNLKQRVAPQSVIIENKKLGCHPCSKIGYNKCPRGHFKCMKDLDMAIVSEQAKNLWSYEKATKKKAV